MTSKTVFEIRFLRLVNKLAKHCPLSVKNQNPKDWKKWTVAYSKLFTLASEVGKWKVL